MSIENRRYIRFSLDLPAYLFRSGGEVAKTLIRQISIGGCLTEWDDNVFVGDNFRLEMELPNKNRLPLVCKALYKFEGSGIGAKFLDISRFEQELLGQTISYALGNAGLPLLVDPFAEPPTLNSAPAKPFNFNQRRRDDEIIEEILSSGK